MKSINSGLFSAMLIVLVVVAVGLRNDYQTKLKQLNDRLLILEDMGLTNDQALRIYSENRSSIESIKKENPELTVRQAVVEHVNRTKPGYVKSCK